MRTSPLPGTKGIRRLSEPAELGQRWPHLIGDLTSAAILPAHGSAHSLGPERQPPHAEQNLYVLDRRLERILAAFSIGCQVGSCASACSPAGRTCSSSRPVATSDCADLSSIHMVLSRRVLFMGLPPVGSVHPETWHSRKRRTQSMRSEPGRSMKGPSTLTTGVTEVIQSGRLLRKSYVGWCRRWGARGNFARPYSTTFWDRHFTCTGSCRVARSRTALDP